MSSYRNVSLVLAVLFAMTGALFLAYPDGAIGFFNSLSPSTGMPEAPEDGRDFYVILSVGYMYLVTVLAFSMFKHPENRVYPLMLIHAKLASSVLSLAFFLLHARYLIYLANFAVDGAIGAAVVVMYLHMRRASWASS